MAADKKNADIRKTLTKEDFMKRSELPKEKAAIQSKGNLQRSGIVDKNGFVKEPYVDLAKEFQEKTDK
ncbi:hypothetical protein SAMN02910358_00439 [Lachnospiraceae bacterium XBB1006]|nr:hypothetical protein SAMN02910358_00439 [Lachnospiraceae bacterium XBB1006]